MPELDQRLRELLDAGAPVTLEEVQRRRAPRLRPGFGHGRIVAVVTVPAAVALAVVLAFTVGSGSGSSSVAVGPSASPGSAPITATVSLQRRTVTAGAWVRGQVVVDNRTARALTLCPATPFVAAGVTPASGGGLWTGYAPLTGGCHAIRLLPGKNRFPLKVATTASTCSQSSSGEATAPSAVTAPTSVTVPTCPASGVAPLAAGLYRVLVHLAGLPAGSRQPPGVPIRLLAAATTCTPISVAEGSTTSDLPCPSHTLVVPDLIGASTPTAAGKLSGIGLSANVVYANSTSIPLGHVISTNPAAGDTVAARSAVTITSSLGAPATTEGQQTVTIGPVQLSIPATWDVASEACPGKHPTLYLGAFPGYCSPSAKPDPAGSVLILLPTHRPTWALPPAGTTINGIAVDNNANAYYLPSVGVTLQAIGPLGDKALNTLTTATSPPAGGQVQISIGNNAPSTGIVELAPTAPSHTTYLAPTSAGGTASLSLPTGSYRASGDTCTGTVVIHAHTTTQLHCP